MELQNINIEHVDCFIFDFDGVLTDNTVYVNQDGEEWVKCSRADGLAFDVLKKIDVPRFILSTEKNQVVSARANKLKVNVIQGIDNKAKLLTELVSSKGYHFERVLYVGNDLNDLNAMSLCGFRACPSDSHDAIIDVAGIRLRSKGGNGVIRELLEDVFKLNFVEILYP